METKPIHVCPVRDVECGSNSLAWCGPQCPVSQERLTKMKSELSRYGAHYQGCQKCGIVGFHACTGNPIPPLSAEAMEHLRKIIDEYKPIPGEKISHVVETSMAEVFGSSNISIVPTSQVVSITLPSSEPPREYVIQGQPLSVLQRKAAAFDKIAELLAIENYDGILARIREIVSAAK